jgi:hypothetical protein
MNFAALIASPFIKFGGVALLVAGVIFGTHMWLDHRDSVAFQRGVDSKTAEVAQAVTRANDNARLLEQAMGSMSNAIGGRANAQQAALTVKLEPLVKELTNAINSDPNARCALSDGVRGAIKDQRATVNAGIAASDPGQPR